MNKKLKLLVQQEIRNAIRNQSLAELAQIAERFAKNGKLLKEEDGGILPSQKDAENIQIMAIAITAKQFIEEMTELINSSPTSLCTTSL